MDKKKCMVYDKTIIYFNIFKLLAERIAQKISRLLRRVMPRAIRK